MFRFGLALTAIASVTLFAACATTPAVPPTRDELKSYAQTHGAEPAYDHYKVAVTGNSILGHEVSVGDTGTTAPARNYFRQSFVDVPHTGDWAYWPGMVLLAGGSIVTTTFAVLVPFDMVPPVWAIGGLVGCALPLICGSAVLNTVSEWDMENAGNAYNEAIRAEMGMTGAVKTPEQEIQPTTPAAEPVKVITPTAEPTPAPESAPASAPAPTPSDAPAGDSAAATD